MAFSDIKRGNNLIHGSDEYAVKYVGDWSMEDADTPSFVKMATEDVTINEQPFSSGAAVSPVAIWTGKSLPIDPVSQATIKRLNLKTPTHTMQTEIAESNQFKFLVLERILA